MYKEHFESHEVKLFRLNNLFSKNVENWRKPENNLLFHSLYMHSLFIMSFWVLFFSDKVRNPNFCAHTATFTLLLSFKTALSFFTYYGASLHIRKDYRLQVFRDLTSGWTSIQKSKNYVLKKTVKCTPLFFLLIITFIFWFISTRDLLFFFFRQRRLFRRQRWNWWGGTGTGKYSSYW